MLRKRSRLAPTCLAMLLSLLPAAAMAMEWEFTQDRDPMTDVPFGMMLVAGRDQFGFLGVGVGCPSGASAGLALMIVSESEAGDAEKEGTPFNVKIRLDEQPALSFRATLTNFKGKTSYVAKLDTPENSRSFLSDLAIVRSKIAVQVRNNVMVIPVSGTSIAVDKIREACAISR